MKSERITRKTQLARRESVREQLRKVFRDITEGYNKQADRSDDNLDWWDIYNCKLSAKQFYNGNSRLYVPLVFEGIEARKTRFLNSLFPQSGRYVDVTSEDGQIPHAEMALITSYVDRAKLKTDVVPAMLIQGDVEGQYTLCTTWEGITRHTVSRETSPITMFGQAVPEAGEEVKFKRETIEDAGPAVSLVPDSDLLILPATAETAEEALERGGSITTICRWSKSRVEDLIKAGEIDSDLSAEVLMEWGKIDGGSHDTAKHLADAAGIKAGGKFLQVYRTWTKIRVGGEKRLVLAYYGGQLGEDVDQVLGCKLCPYWCDKPDIITRPVRKLPGVAKGRSIVKSCADLQYAANDAINEGMDSATYSMLPVILTDPEKNPRVGSMVMDLMAVWQTSPNDTKPLTFPPLYQQAFAIVQAAKQEIMATLGVNAAMLPQSTGVPGRKRNQAEIALEQQIDIMATSVEIATAEGVLSELVSRFAEYDAQFRDVETTVRQVGMLGVRAEMVKVPPLEMGRRWRYRWFGVEATRTAQQAQQKIAGLNVLQQWSQHPAVQQQGYVFNPVPVLVDTTETVYGPRISGEIFKKASDQMALPAELENQMLLSGFEVPVHPADDDPRHIKEHVAALQQTLDPMAQMAFRTHIQAHQKKMQMMMMQKVMQTIAQAVGPQQGQGQPQGGPRPALPGAQPQMPRQMRGPPGAIRPTQVPQPGGVVPMPIRR